MLGQGKNRSSDELESIELGNVVVLSITHVQRNVTVCYILLKLSKVMLSFAMLL